MDWNNYLLMIQRVDGGSFLESFQFAEPAFATILWLSAKSGLGVYGANFVAATIFCLGLFRLARRMPLPWLALATAMPILVMVVSMSASRQAVAIGVLMWLVAEWEDSSILKRVTYTIVAAMFHFSAIFFLAFAVLGLKVRPGYKVALGILMGVIMLAFLQVSGGADYYDQLYVSGQAEVTYSSGATQHVLLNGLPALLVLFGRRVRAKLFPGTLLVQMAWLAILLVPTAFFFSAAAGRMTLYLFPVSMYAFSGMPDLIGDRTLRAVLRTALAAVLFVTLGVWLEFANSSYAHIPYRNALMMDSQDLHL